MPLHKEIKGTVKGRPMIWRHEGYSDGKAIYIAHSLLAGPIILEIPKDYEAVDKSMPTFKKGDKIQWPGRDADTDVPAGEYVVLSDSDETVSHVAAECGDNTAVFDKMGLKSKGLAP